MNIVIDKMAFMGEAIELLPIDHDKIKNFDFLVKLLSEVKDVIENEIKYETDFFIRFLDGSLLELKFEKKLRPEDVAFISMAVEMRCFGWRLRCLNCKRELITDKMALTETERKCGVCSGRFI